LENRTRDSKREMESIEKLEELRDLNTRVAASMFVLNLKILEAPPNILQ
jgi:Family of unknown function (DUF572).